MGAGDGARRGRAWPSDCLMPTIQTIATHDFRRKLKDGAGSDAVHTDPSYGYGVTLLKMPPRSRAPLGLIPEAIEPATKPLGATTPPGTTGNPSRLLSVLAIHGKLGGASRPAFSTKPSTRFAFCTAEPAAPLPRLSTAAIATTVRVVSSVTV
mgnify:CR=1 FL=1